MPSAFRRGPRKSAVAGSAPLGTPTASPASFRPPRGVKPWQGGTYLTSTGLNDFDSILGGGQLLGSSILLEEDRLWTRDLALTLVKYWCAEVGLRKYWLFGIYWLYDSQWQSTFNFY